jgi:hypothetical protein
MDALSQLGRRLDSYCHPIGTPERVPSVCDTESVAVRHFLLVALTFGIPMAAPGLHARACASSWSYSEAFRDQIVSIVTATDTGTVRIRQGFGLPAAADTAVVFETDSTACAQAAGAFNAELARYGGTPGAVWVLRVGTTRFIVFDHRQKTGEFYDHMVFDENFVYKLTITSG